MSICAKSELVLPTADGQSKAATMRGYIRESLFCKRSEFFAYDFEECIQGVKQYPLGVRGVGHTQPVDPVVRERLMVALHRAFGDNYQPHILRWQEYKRGVPSSCIWLFKCAELEALCSALEFVDPIVRNPPDQEHGGGEYLTIGDYTRSHGESRELVYDPPLWCYVIPISKEEFDAGVVNMESVTRWVSSEFIKSSIYMGVGPGGLEAEWMEHEAERMQMRGV